MSIWLLSHLRSDNLLWRRHLPISKTPTGTTPPSVVLNTSGKGKSKKKVTKAERKK